MMPGTIAPFISVVVVGVRAVDHILIGSRARTGLWGRLVSKYCVIGIYGHVRL